ncbi:MAG: glycerol kinase GlpK [Gammaproteobacteria bacterium]
MSQHIIAIDQGTTSSRAIVFDGGFRSVGVGQREFAQHFPDSGWVEHEPEDIWETTRVTVREALDKAGLMAADIAAIGITNQRETTLIWDRETGKAIHRAIVWQDRRTAPLCERLKAEGHEALFAERTGLLLDPYFSGTKVAWMLDRVPGARERAEAGKLAFGTVDSFLIWRLTGGRVHATDATNASRTLLYNIRDNRWDEELLRILDIPASMLPEVKDCADDFGTTDPALFGGAIAIRGVAGDQQAALMGQACFGEGMIKSTYGTGCFAVLNTGTELVRSNNKLLSTIGYRLNGKTTYALEGSIFIAGAAVQWLRDGLGIVDSAPETGPMAAAADPNQRVYLVPAFVGLGAPHWDADARGALFGLTRGTGPREIARAALEAVCYQTLDLLEAMRGDAPGMGDTVLRVDGGMVASDWTMQRLADLLDAPVDRPEVLETTAMGAAWLAGMHAGVWPDQEGFADSWRRERRFEPSMGSQEREALVDGWRDAVARTLSRGCPEPQ